MTTTDQLPDQVALELVQAAVAAPSMHNVQPWKFRVRTVSREIQLYADPTRSLTPALVNGSPGVVVTADGRVVSIMAFAVSGGRVVAIDALGDPERLAKLRIHGRDV